MAAAITELEVSATEVARSTDGAKDEVDRADAEAKQGRQKVATTRRITEQLASDMESAVGITHKLGEFSNNIGSILDVIRGIAEQTNCWHSMRRLKPRVPEMPDAVLRWWRMKFVLWLRALKPRPKRSNI